MRDYEKDYWNLYFHKISHHTYARIYEKTNEHLNKILTRFDFADKDVLSVMGSSDHPFSAYYLGAKNVDTFDNEYLTYYYFYLRKWIILLHNRRMFINFKLISECIAHAEGEEEKNAAAFWKLILNNFSERDIKGLFYPQSYEWDTPFDEDEKTLSNILKDKKANFHEWDLFKEINVDKQYEIIILSNMLEYLQYNDELMKVASQNLDNLLKPNGIIISINLRGYNYGQRHEFNKYFEYVEGKKAYKEKLEKEVPLYYSYIRK